MLLLLLHYCCYCCCCCLLPLTRNPRRRESPARAISRFAIFLDRPSLTSPRCFYIASLFYGSFSEDGIRSSVFTRQREGKQRRRCFLSSAFDRAKRKRKVVRGIEMHQRKNAPVDGGNKAFRAVVGHNFRSFRDRISWRQCILGTAIPDATDPENTAGITVPR